MVQPNDVPPQSAILRNIDMSLECNDLVPIRPIVRVSEETLDSGIVLIVMHLSDPINNRSGQRFHRDRSEEMFIQDCDIFVVLWSSGVFF